MQIHGTGSDGPALSRWWNRLGLATKVILMLTVILSFVSGVSAYIDFRKQESLLLGEMVRAADQISKTIVSSTWQAMLRDQREAAYEVMQTVGRQQGIEKIRIFNKEGRVMFSTGDDDGDMVDKDAEACHLCHSREKPLVHVDVPSRARMFKDRDGQGVLGMVTPIYNEPACSRAECHAHPPEIHVLGVLDVSVDLEPVENQRKQLRLAALGRTAIEILLLALVIVFFTRRFIGKPIRRLIQASRTIGGPGGKSDQGEPLNLEIGDDLAQLQFAFEEMRQRLDLASVEIDAFTKDLERKVRERTNQLESTREQLVRAERLASLGRLAASVAHEVNNPISGILSLSRLMERIVDKQGIPPERVEEVRRYLTQVSGETARIGRIVSDLLSFSRQAPPRIQPEDLAEVARRTLSLLSIKLRLRNIAVDLQVAPELPRVSCDAQQMEQVMINLVMNASEAGPDGARISLRLLPERDKRYVAIEVEDYGVGIQPEHLGRVFEPFFTTKDDGKGVGLGLAVAYGIIEAHGGTIEVRSDPGKGTLFKVRLPAQSMGGTKGEVGGS
jgi:two-component system NtrC family sensor kinase